MGLKIVIVGFVIALATIAFSLPSPFLIAGAIVAIIGVVIMFISKEG